MCIYLSLRGMKKDKLPMRTGSVKQGEVDSAAASAQYLLHICESDYLQLFAGLHKKKKKSNLYAHTL